MGLRTREFESCLRSIVPSCYSWYLLGFFKNYSNKRPPLSHTQLPEMIVILVVYYEETKRELKKILLCLIYECRCNERLKAKAEGSRRLAYNGLREGLEHLKIKTRLRGGRFESVKGECVI